ncbi:hypothetical protein [Sporosarcina sp. G11-34]|uniref:hypothetical protein n=1 Tax=Sporosarcina sp. G11-34 TaxID=2849605 RepID=UPI0022A9A682|nr:hypothetical protein [Sporosarcina sp. G11-34]MCZ2257334.1 hypothetical protein [Sporosarcina sp. G11-34]
MNKNNKKTMNERTHNSLELYKDNKINDNDSNPNNKLNEEFSTDLTAAFDSKGKHKKQQPSRNT